jgi:hypothetical protein
MVSFVVAMRLQVRFAVSLGILIACASSLALGQAGVSIESPREYQVFQRQSKASGTILVAGLASAGDRAEARLTGSSSAAALPSDWTPVAIDSQSHRFRGELRVPAGGWYELEVRAMKGGQAIARETIAHVGVGEVFVVAGQSNATNYGEVRQQARTGMVAALGPAGWQLANDPQPGVQDHSTKGSFIPAFGDAMYERYRVPIGVVAVGHGSTSVRQWLPTGERFAVPPTMGKFVHAIAPGVWECDGTLFDGMMAAIQRLSQGGFRALLWHQGESDAHQKPDHDIPAEEYKRLMELVIRRSREQAGWDFPWFVAQASYHTPNDPSCPPIREAQQSLWREGIVLEGPDTDQLVGSNRQNGGAGVHFSEQGLAAHGRVWAEKVGAYLDRVLD